MRKIYFSMGEDVVSVLSLTTPSEFCFYYCRNGQKYCNLHIVGPERLRSVRTGCFGCNFFNLQINHNLVLVGFIKHYAPVKVNPCLPQAGDYGGIAKAFSGFSEIKRHWGTGKGTG